MNQIYAFLHAHEAQAVILPCFFDVESGACVPHDELNLFRGGEEGDGEMIGSAIFHCIVERFLGDSEETQRDIFWKRLGDTGVGEVDVYLVLFCKLIAEASYGRHNAQEVELGGVQLVGQRLNVASQLRAVVADILKILFGLISRAV